LINISLKNSTIKGMKVLLINPPSGKEIVSCNPEFLNQERGYTPPLGILYLASYLEKFSDFEVKVLDCQVEETKYSQLGQIIKKIDPDVIGITAMTFTLLDVLEVIKIAQQAKPDAKIVLGGPHPQIYPEETINLPEVDYVILGEGEISFLELLKCLKEKDYKKLNQIKGLTFKKDGQIINTGPSEPIKNLDELPFPARHLTPYQKYYSIIARKNPVTTMFTSRGCPYRCSFCDRPAMGKVFRARSAKNVVDEMQECKKLGINEIFMYDDTFTVNRQRVLDICREIKERNLNILWDIRARVDTVDEEMLKALKKAGCQRIHYGVETGTEKILKVLNKGITLKQAEEAFRLTKKVGMQTLAYFILGSPTETKEDILKTMSFAKKLNPDFVQFTLLTPFPATQIYLDGLKQGSFKYDHWQKFAENPTPDFQTIYWEEIFTKEELITFLNQAYKSFYLRPSFIIKEIFRIRSLSEITKKVKAGLRIIFS